MEKLARSLAGFNRKSGRIPRRRFVGAVAATLMLVGLTAGPAIGATTLPPLWTAGGLSAGIDSAGQAERMAVDAWGNVAIVSGPAEGLNLAVTSYTSDGELRWQSMVSPTSGTFRGDWVAAAPNGDFVAVGHNVTSSGNPIAITLVRYASDGTLLWRVDLARTFPAVGRLLVDAAGDTYLAFNSVGNGQDIQLHKYNSAGRPALGEGGRDGHACQRCGHLAGAEPGRGRRGADGEHHRWRNLDHGSSTTPTPVPESGW